MSKNGSRHLAADVVHKEKISDAVPPETFNFDNEDKLRWALAEERLKSARMAVHIAQQSVQTTEKDFLDLRNALTAKYSENGKYKFVGAVDLASGVGQRQLAGADERKAATPET